MSAIYDKVFTRYKSETLALGDIADIVKGKQVNATELTEKGDYYVMNGGITPSGYYSSYNTEAETISISEGGNSCGYVQYNVSRFWSGGHCYTLTIKNEEEVSNLYLYHFLKWREKDIMALRIGSGLPNIQKKDLMVFPVQLANASNQLSIVALLDSTEKKIRLEEDILLQFDRLRKFLLSQMFI